MSQLKLPRKPNHAYLGMNADVRIYYPTLEQMNDFPAYIKFMKSQNADKAPFSKIIPPPSWKPTVRECAAPEDVEINFIERQLFTASDPNKLSRNLGTQAFRRSTLKPTPTTLGAFRKLASQTKFARNTPNFESRNPSNKELNASVKMIWKTITRRQAVYGMDLTKEGASLFDSGVPFNLNELQSDLNVLETVPGFNRPFLYYGSFGSCSCWHIKEADTESINFVHRGAPKFWYGVPPHCKQQLEALFNDIFDDVSENCKSPMRHKNYAVSPAVLRAAGIPFATMVQNRGEFIVVWAKAAHMGFNLGFNVAEAVNFASEGWIDVAKSASFCTCVGTSVRLPVGELIAKFQPEELKNWKRSRVKPTGKYKYPNVEMQKKPTTVSQKSNSRAIIKKKRPDAPMEERKKWVIQNLKFDRSSMVLATALTEFYTSWLTEKHYNVPKSVAQQLGTSIMQALPGLKDELRCNNQEPVYNTGSRSSRGQIRRYISFTARGKTAIEKVVNMDFDKMCFPTRK